ncbi:MAG: Rrf2 family transcriptional regulator [Pirellulaceae bacterium]
MQLTRFTDYSLRLLIYLAVQNRLCTVKEVADYYGISRNHLVKATHQLAKLGFIESVKGKGGGIRLNHSPDQLNLRDVVEKVEPGFDLVECLGPNTSCQIEKTCGLKSIIDGSLSAFLQHLGRYTLADAIRTVQLVELKKI